MNSTSAPQHAVKVLLVEDNKSDVAMLRRLLGRARMLEFGITDTDYLNSAITLVRNPKDGQFDVILLDLNLQDSRGIDTVTVMAREAPDVPIVVLSGQEDIKVADSALQVGAEDFIVKKDPSGLSERDMIDEIERKVWFAIRRHAQRATARQLARTSLEKAGAASGDPALVQLIRGHIRALEEGVQEFRRFLGLHYPEAWDAMRRTYEDKILQSFRELHGILKLEESEVDPSHRPTRKAPSGMRISADVSDLASQAPYLSTTLEDAERRLLDALQLDPFAKEAADD